MLKEKLKKVEKNIYELPKSGKMHVPGRIFASERLFKDIEETCVKQVENVAELPGIVKYSLSMPDVHSGYGFSIGGVAAFDIEKGIISPGGVGYDINCGVRLLKTNISKSKLLEKRKELLGEIYKLVPSGVGEGSKLKLTDEDLNQVLENGARWAIEKGYGINDDLKHIEDNGCIKEADAGKVSPRAKSRGRDQLGTLGAGNHFLELQEIESIFDEKSAKEFGIDKENIMVMIHTGSRGLGHQTASDYIMKMEKEYGWKNLPDRELICAPINSKLGIDYREAMNAAANFAFANRQIITAMIRKAFLKFFPDSKIELIYDVAHNIAKFEDFVVDGKKQTLCVHRKGATRSREGIPIIIPGSMGTFSYLLRGTKKAEEISFASTAHGAGRVMSRAKAKQMISEQHLRKEMSDNDILLKAGSTKGAIEEAPEAYKDVNEVVKVSNELGIGKIVARLKPLAVVKG